MNAIYKTSQAERVLELNDDEVELNEPTAQYIYWTQN